MSESWYKHSCLAYGYYNWINNGDTDDQTVLDITDYNCWQCNKEIRMCSGEHEDEWVAHVIDENVDEYSGAHTQGLEKPE